MSVLSENSRRAVRQVAGREVSTRLRSRSFLIVGTLMLVFVLALIGVSAFLNGRSARSDVGFTPAAARLAPTLRATASGLGQHVTVHQVPSVQAGERQVRGGHLDALVTTGPDGSVGVTVKSSLATGLRGTLGVIARQAALDRSLAALHRDPAAADQAAASAGVRIRRLAPLPPTDRERIVLGILVGGLLYVSLMLSGQAVAQGVVEEKSSRVVELLLAVVRPWQLMLGKVLGITVVGLLQVTVLAAVGIGAGVGTGVLHLPTSAAVGTGLWSLAWYLLGFFMFALLCAAAGATVSRQEEIGGVVSPIMTIIIASFIVSTVVLPRDPGNALVAVASVVPLFSPVLMPMREALGVVPLWQAVLALALSALTSAGLVWLTARVYGNAVLQTGARVRLLRSLRAG